MEENCTFRISFNNSIVATEHLGEFVHVREPGARSFMCILFTAHQHARGRVLLDVP